MATKISHDKLLLPIMRAFMRNEADFSKFPNELYGQMRLFITDFVPVILVSDGFNQMEAQFSKDCINEFRKLNNHIKFSAQRDKVIYVQEWILELKYRPSQTCPLNFSNLGIIFQVTKFKLLAREHINKVTLSQIENAYIQDDLIRYFISKFLHKMTRDMAYRVSHFDINDDVICSLPPTQDEDVDDLDCYLQKRYGTEDDQMDDIKRIFIEERGEQEWCYMQKMAMDSIMNYFELTKERQEHLNKIKYVQIQPLDRQVIKTVEPLKPRTRTVWKAGASAQAIKEQLVRILQQATNVKMVQQPQKRERALSQDDNPAAIILDEASHHGREALSQFVAHPNDFDTETEDEEEEEKASHQLVQSNFLTYQKYISWFEKHDVTTMSYIIEQERMKREEEEKLRRQQEDEEQRQREEQERLRIEEERQKQEAERLEQLRLEKEKMQKEQLMRLKQEKDRRDRELVEEQERLNEQQRKQLATVDEEPMVLDDDVEEFKRPMPKSKPAFVLDDEDEEEDEVQKQLLREMEIMESRSNRSTPSKIMTVKEEMVTPPPTKQIAQSQPEIQVPTIQPCRPKPEIIVSTTHEVEQNPKEIASIVQQDESKPADNLIQPPSIPPTQSPPKVTVIPTETLSEDEIFKQKMMQRMLQTKLEAERQKRLANMTEEEKQAEKEREEKEKKEREEALEQERKAQLERENAKQEELERQRQEQIEKERLAELKKQQILKQEEEERQRQEHELKQKLEKERIEKLKIEAERKNKEEEEAAERKRKELAEEELRIIARQKEAEKAHCQRINEAKIKKIQLEDQIEQAKIKQRRQRYQEIQEEEHMSPESKRKKKEARKKAEEQNQRKLDETLKQIQMLAQAVQQLQNDINKSREVSDDSESEDNIIKSETESDDSDTEDKVLTKRRRYLADDTNDQEDDITPKRQKRKDQDYCNSPTPPDEKEIIKQPREQSSIAKAILKSTKKKHIDTTEKSSKEVRFSNFNQEMIYNDISSSQDSQMNMGGSVKIRSYPSDEVSLQKRKLMAEVMGVLNLSPSK